MLELRRPEGADVGAIGHLQGGERQQLLRLDPVTVILNGDAAALNRPERVMALAALAASAADNRWFRSGMWVDHPFGPLATADMVDEYRGQLSRPDRDAAHQAYIDCLLDALKHAHDDMPPLAPLLVAWVEDGLASEGIRLTAYEAWKRHCPAGDQTAQLTQWLEGLHAGSVHDPDDRLLGRMLRDAYPGMLQADVFRYLRPKQNRQLIAEFTDFWGHYLLRQTPAAALPALADAWLARFPNGLPHEWQLDCQRTADQLLVAVIEAAGDHVPIATLYHWLGIGLDEREVPRSGQDERKTLATWLESRPDRLRALFAHGYAVLRPDSQGGVRFWLVEVRLRGAARPMDWLQWNMALAANSDNEPFVRWVVQGTAAAVLDPPAHMDVPTIDDLTAWVSSLADRFPAAPGWLEASWTMSLDDWRADDHRRQASDRTKSDVARALRRSAFEPELAKLGLGPMRAGVLKEIAYAYDERFYDIKGPTPEDRVAELLGVLPWHATASLSRRAMACC